MLRSVYLKTLRDMRWGVLGWGIGIGVWALVTAIGWAKAYPDEASRAQLAGELRGGLSVAQAFYGPATGIDQLGGFLEWRVLGLLPVLLGIYVVLSATGMTRGAEESRTIEAVVATPMTRLRVLTEQAAALATGVVLTLTITAVLVMGAGSGTGQSTLSLLRVAGAFVDVAAAALLFGAMGLLAGQLFARRRTAALVATGVMTLFHLGNTIPLVAPALHGLRYASPLYLYTASTPLSNGHMNWLALSGMLLLAVVVVLFALLMSEQRDLLDTYHRRREVAHAPDVVLAGQRSGPASRQVFLRNGFGRGLRDAFGAGVSWAAGLSALAVLFAALTPNMRQALLQQASGPILRELERAGAVSEKGILSLLISFLVPPLVAVFGLTLAASWAGDETNQRLELELSMPVARWKVFLERFAASVTMQAITIAVVAVAMVITVRLIGADVPIGAVGAGSWTLVVMAASVTAVAFGIASWRPGMVTAVGGAFVVVSYFAGLVIPLLGLPSWVRYVSVFSLYGSPIGDGVIYWRVGVLLALALVFAGAGALEFQRRDIVK